ncbi:class I SAM-dependent methyltransferase [Pedococcus sp. NPDC057267]|uniref:class I SAM-dependent methyltransferase n=1 Tax=Pedococcus sp. NPDC057267 TaxID=3346077 RepID=UPI00363A39DF
MWSRYTAVAPVYDVLSAEWPVYRVGRRLAMPLLRLRPGDTVVDVGCGTGLNFPMLAAGVGHGHVVAVDSSAHMLAAARHKARTLERATGCRVLLHQEDATAMGRLRREVPALRDGADAVLFTYSLSVMRPWRQAWQQARSLARPGARVAVVDMTTPCGPSRLLSPLARLACALGGADINAHPWQALVADCIDVTHEQAWGGHVQVWAGTVP